MIDRELIHRINKGEESAFRILYEAYFHKVANYAFKLLHSKEDAHEVAQDVFVKLWHKRCDLDVNQSIDGLIFKVTKFVSIDLLRRQSKVSLTSFGNDTMEVAGQSLENQIMDKELFEIYNSIIAKLPEKRRHIFQLSRDEHMSHKEIADQLNISIKTVEAQIRLALQQIRHDLRNYSDKILIIIMLLASMGL